MSRPIHIAQHPFHDPLRSPQCGLVVTTAAALLILATTADAQSCRNGRCVDGGAYRIERDYATAYVAPAHVYPAPQVQALAAAYVPPRAGHGYRERVKVRRRFGRHRGCCR